MESEATFNAGDVCLDCQHKGLEKYLRYFKINLHGDTILKCESSECMYPYNDEYGSSDEDEKSIGNISQTNSLKLINDLIQQFDYEDQVQDTLNHVPINDNVSENVTQFDITFLDDINSEGNENLCKTEVKDEKKDFLLHDFEDEIIASKCYSISGTNVLESGLSCEATDGTKGIQNCQETQINFADESFKSYNMVYELPLDVNGKDNKEKIVIKSVVTISDELPTSSKSLTKNNENSTKSLYTTLETTDLQKDIPKTIKAEHKVNIVSKTKIKCPAKSVKSSRSTTSAQLPGTTKTTSTKSLSCDIPKADILKANALLKKFATIEDNDRPPKLNTKCKKVRTKNKKQKTDIKNPEANPQPPQQNDSDYSFDKITKILFPKYEGIP